ncbi:MAG: S9 family peptidase [Actinobacteria bacterium]|nr:S9 family peptidase [Actinomycetota bacterium]
MARPRRSPPRFEQFFAIRRFQPTLAFTPDGRRILFITNTSGQFNLWRTSVGGGRQQQLTAFDANTVRAVAPSPDGKTIVFIADHDGDEFHQIYALPASGGWPEQWTEARQVQHFVDSNAWSPDGSRFAFAANSRVPKDMDVWVRDSEGNVRKVFGNEMYAFPASWSPDGRMLLAVDFRSNTDTSLHLVDVDSDEARELTPHEDETRYLPGPWSPDGSGFYLLSDEGREFVALAFFRLNGGLEWVETPDGDVEELAMSRNGRVLGWVVNEQGWSRVRLRDLETGTDLPEPVLPAGSASWTGLTLSPDGRHAALIWQGPQRPAELFAVDTSNGKARRLTDSMLGGLRPRTLIEPELVSYPSFDGREIPAWLYRPKQRSRVPVVLSIHGGPESQERPVYMPLYQYLMSRGIAVLATNIRGSSGYGKTYQKLIHHDWGGADVRDWDHAAKWLIAQDWVDPDRIAVWGGSYGGFAVLSCVTRLPDYWRCAVDIFGPSNLITFVRAVPPTWKRFMDQWVGNPDTEADFLIERSPITYVEQVKAPLLVIQGATDPRVVKPESDQMVERLRGLGREVEYEVFEDEGHGFTRRSNELRAFRLSADWLERHLG